MRIRFKPWAREELESSKFYIDNPQDYKNKWKTLFENKNASLSIELGCGKGNFIAKKASENLDRNFIAIDLVDAMLGLAKRNIEKEFGIRETINKEEIENEREKQEIIKNVIITRYDISRISDILGKKDEVSKIYINFCNPWPRGKHHKKRLTFDTQLNQYKTFLKKDGKIYFKTDNDELFNDSLIYFKRCGFEVIKVTGDLESEENFWEEEENIKTEHEKMFEEQGIKIKGVIVKNK